MDTTTTKRVRSISDKQKIRAATNDPSLAEVSFTLGDREFKIVDLEYDAYVAFLSHLQPLMEILMGKLGSIQGLTLPQSENLNAASLVAYCAGSLPAMATIVCQSTDPNITVDEVKKLAKNPFKMASVVLEQINHNKMIKDFSDFFLLVLPLMKPIAKKNV